MNLTTALLIATTLPHFLVPLVAPNSLYGGIAFLSSCFSVAWHASETDAFSALGLVDHAAAAAWTGLDIYVFYGTDMFGPMLVVNTVVAGLDWLCSWGERRGLAAYWVSHSAWHLISAAKSIYLARQL